MDRQLIEEFVACSGRLRQAVTGLSQQELTARPGPGDWCILGVRGRGTGIRGQEGGDERRFGAWCHCLNGFRLAVSLGIFRSAGN
jgi:hypothetical protein